MTESDSYSDALIQRINLMIPDGPFYNFIKIGYLPVEMIKGTGDSGRYSSVVKNLKKRVLIKGSPVKKQVEGSRLYAFEMTHKMADLITFEECE